MNPNQNPHHFHSKLFFYFYLWRVCFVHPVSFHYFLHLILFGFHSICRRCTWQNQSLGVSRIYEYLHDWRVACSRGTFAVLCALKRKTTFRQWKGYRRQSFTNRFLPSGYTSGVGMVKTTLVCPSSTLFFLFEFPEICLRLSASLFIPACEVKRTFFLCFFARRSENEPSKSFDCLDRSSLRFLKKVKMEWRGNYYAEKMC